LAWNKLGMGEDLPYGVYKQWKHWCQFPHFFFDDPSMKGIATLFERYNKTLVAVNAIDDKWATSLSRDAFMPFYKHAKLTNIDLRPSDYGLAKVEHMGYFFKHASALWTPIFDCFALELDSLKNNNKHNIDDVAQLD
jgi:predicted alpha/beta hydrolase